MKRKSAKSMVMQTQYASKTQRNRKKDYKRKDKYHKDLRHGPPS